MTDRHTQFRERFEELLMAAPKPDLEAGWRLARELGRPVAPLLWQMLQAERSRIDDRMALLVAAVLAGGPGADDRLFALLDRPQPQLRERALAALLLALGPEQDRPVDEVRARLLGPGRKHEQLLELLVELACARFPGASSGVVSGSEVDPGLLAARSYAGMPVSAKASARLWRSDDAAALLFRRGAMLGSWRALRQSRGASSGSPRWLREAQDLLQTPDLSLLPLRQAAVLLVAAAGELDRRGARPDWRLLQLAAGEPAASPAIDGWLSSTPLSLDEQPGRLAAGYALRRPVAEVLQAAPEWSRQPRGRVAVTLALAMRLLADAPAERELPAVDPALREWALVVWANGGAIDGEVSEDPQLQLLGRLAAGGRIDRRAAHTMLEDVLWRRDSHPASAAYRVEREFVRDLVLAGSTPGSARYAPHIRENLLYFPSGLDRDDPFFRVAVALYELLDEPFGGCPDDLRWRGS